MSEAYSLIVFGIGGLALVFSAICSAIGFMRGEWSFKRTNDAINDVSDEGADWGSEGAFHNPAFTSDTE